MHIPWLNNLRSYVLTIHYTNIIYMTNALLYRKEAVFPGILLDRYSRDLSEPNKKKKMEYREFR